MHDQLCSQKMEASQLSKLTKKQKNVLVAAEKKHFCDQKALHIVELLIEPVVDQAWLLHHLQFIDQNHYNDVTEERSCTGCCGYPLCARQIGPMPTHQFQISTITNRIYDISERKKYCSNACFRASRHLKPQIQTSPLWLRDKEPPPVFKLIDEEDNRRGVAGDLVDLGMARAPADEPPPAPPAQMTTSQLVTDMMHQFDELSGQIRDLGLKPEEEESKETEERGQRKERRSCLRHPGDGGRDAEGRTVQFGSAVDGERGDTGEQEAAGQPEEQRDDVPGGRGRTRSTVRGCDSSEPVSASLSVPEETVTPSVTTDDPTVPQDPPEETSSGTNTTPAPPPEVTAPQTQPSPAAPTTDRPPAPTCGFKRPVRAARRQQQHPVKVVEARLLDWMSGRRPVAAAVPVADPLRVEIPAGGGGGVKAAGSDAAAAVSADPAGVVSAPVISPAEAAARNRALTAYMQGRVRLPPAAPPRPAPATAPAQQLTEDGRPVPPEPLLESQDKQRRRIVNDHLSKATARLLPPLGLLMSDVASPLRQLVASFHLTAQNVTMTPSQWTLAALVLLKCLLRQSAELASLARDVEAAFSRALQPLQLTPAGLDLLVDRLQDLLTSAPGSGSDPGVARSAAGVS